MGAQDFEQYQQGTEVRAAFDAATAQARHEHGHGGYTGTLAEKHAYAVVETGPLTMAEARARIAALRAAEEGEYDDKWGPAGAIPIWAGTREEQVAGLEGTRADLPRKAEEALRAAGRIAEGEVVAACSVVHYRQPPRNPYAYGGYAAAPQVLYEAAATVTIRQAPGAPRTTDGWLFFGVASS